MLVLAILPVLAVVALSVFITWFDADNQHTRQQLQDLIRQASGYEVKLAGKLELELQSSHGQSFSPSFIPSLILIANHVEILEPAGTTLFSAAKLSIETDLFSLVEGRLLLEQIILDNVRVSITRLSDGTLKLPGHQVAEKGNNQQQSSSLLPVKSIALRNSRFLFEDELTNRQYQFDNIMVNLQAITDNNFKIAADTALSISGESLKTIAGSLKLSLDLAMGEQIEINLSDLQAALTYADQPIDFEIKGKASFSNDGKLMQADQVKLLSSSTGLQATINSRYQYEKQVLNIEVEQLNPSSIVSLLSENVSSSATGSRLKTFSGDFDIRHDEQYLEIEIPAMQIDDVRSQGRIILGDELIDIQLKLDALQPDPYLYLFAELPGKDSTDNDEPMALKANVKINRLLLEQGSIDNFALSLVNTKGQLQFLELGLDAIDVNPALLLRRYSREIKLLPEDLINLHPDNFSKLQGRGIFKLDMKHQIYQLTDLDFSIDDTSVKGSVLFNGNESKLDAQVFIGRLDLDRYEQILQSVQQDTKSAKDTDKNGLNQLLQSLKQLQGSGSLQIEWLKYQQQVYEKGEILFNDA